jgi:S-adenosylmethionine hydrolase
MSIITLITDYGLKDHFVGSIKGKLISEFPEVKIVDISHNIDPFNIPEASYILSSAYSSFPKGTVHLIGVDIEKNHENQHIAMQWNDHFFVCADNGILSMLIDKINPQKIVSINIHERTMPDASDIDVFIKVACHIAKGGALSVIGKEINAIKIITELQPTIESNSIKGAVVYIDNFGNIVSNISKKIFNEVSQNRAFEILIRNKSVKTIFNKYSDIGLNKFDLKSKEGEKIAIFNEAGFLEIALFRSNKSTVGCAADLLGMSYRDVIIVNFK